MTLSTTVAHTLQTILLSPPIYLARNLLLKPLSWLLHIVLLPPNFLISSIQSTTVWFYELIASLQTYIIFTAFAALTGCFAGLLVYYMSRGLEALLHISPNSSMSLVETTQALPKRTLQSWRQARQQKKEQAVLDEQRKVALIQDRIRNALDAKPMRSPWPSWSQTIVEEEEDSDF